MNDLMNELKGLIIKVLSLEDMTIDDIDNDEPLFVEGLGLDSIDALELGVAIKKTYDIQLEAESNTMQEHFKSVRTLAEFIQANRKDKE